MSALDDLQRDGEDVVISSADAVVHLEYDPTNLPSVEQVAEKHGGGNWTRFVCISDTHSKTFDVPHGDVLLHSGDLTQVGREGEMKKTMEWIYSMPHKVKIVIAGNHDLPLHRGWYDNNWKKRSQKKLDFEPIHEWLVGKMAKESGVIYLENQAVKFRVAPERREWSVYGSPWQPEFFNWAFNYKRDEAEGLVSKYESTDILLTHGPPHQILDQTRGDEMVGCEALAAHITCGRLRPRLHAFGHIHEAHGAHIHSWESTGVCEPLQVQNDINYPIQLSPDDSEDEAAGRREKLEPSPPEDGFC
ncbi:hypothetical protein H1R20_g12943, partial [Candolleomyces eurysporus]